MSYIHTRGHLVYWKIKPRTVWQTVRRTHQQTLATSVTASLSHLYTDPVARLQHDIASVTQHVLGAHEPLDDPTNNKARCILTDGYKLHVSTTRKLAFFETLTSSFSDMLAT